MKNTKRFFITGVSSGFGRAIANAALKAGHRVIGTVRTEQAAAEFEAQIREEAHVKLLDVTQFDSVAPLAGVVEAELGPVDVVINNAVASDAISSSRPMERIATRGWATAFG